MFSAWIVQILVLGGQQMAFDDELLPLATLHLEDTEPGVRLVEFQRDFQLCGLLLAVGRCSCFIQKISQGTTMLVSCN